MAELTITDHSWSPVSHLYQSLHEGRRGAYLANILMEGRAERARGGDGAASSSHDHPFNQDLVISEVYELPFRELWMRDGVPDLRPPDPAPDRLSRMAPGAPDDRARRTRPSSSSSTRRPARAGARSSSRRCSRRSPGRRRPRARPDARAGRRGAAHRGRRSPGGFRHDRGGGRRRHLEQRGRRDRAVGHPGASSGLVPGGTGCDLAKSLGIPARDVAALRAGSSSTATRGRSTWGGSRTGTS